MLTSCGLVLLINSPEGKRVLLAHVTNQPQWDLPKGVQEDSETPIDCVIRELKEETSIDFTNTKDSDGFLDLGIFDYLPYKKLHLFLYDMEDTIPDINTMLCTSTFEMYNKNFPEVDRFEYVLLTDIPKYTSPKMCPVLTKALQDYGLI